MDGLWPQLVRQRGVPAEDEMVARHEAHAQWRTNVFEGEVSQELRTPHQFEDARGT